MKKIKQFFAISIMALAGSTIFVSCGSDEKTIECTVSPTEVVLSSEKGASTSFGITFEEGSAQWKITQIPDFVTVYPQSGSGAGTVKISALGDNNSKYPNEGVITIEVEGTNQQTVKVVQQNLDECWVQPANILQMCDGLAFNWNFGANVKYYYWGIFTQSKYNKMSESEVIDNIVTGEISDRSLPDNDNFACFYNLNSNTNYVVVTVSFADGDRQGEVVVTPLTTKSTANQPEAAISDMNYYSDDSNNYYYGWNVKKNTYCSQYYTYAAASTSNFYVYYLIDKGCYPLIAWLINNEIKKDGQDHSTSMNEGIDNMPFNSGRDKFYAAQVENGVSYFTAFPYSDTYFCVITWGAGNSGELSGLLNGVYYDFSEDTSEAKKWRSLKTISPNEASGEPKKLNINTKDIKLTRLN